MANVLVDENSLQSIANAIREKNGTENTYKPNEMSQAILDITSSNGEEYEKGFEAGKQAEYDKFWDTLQKYGEPANYFYAFAYNRFNDEIYNPKYDIVCSAGNTPSQSLFHANSLITDTKVAIKVSINSATNIFYSASALKTVRKIISADTTLYNNSFKGCIALENIIFEGVIGKDIDFSDCVLLTKDSLLSIINALKDYSGTTTTMTLTLGTTNLAKLTDEEKAVATQKGWTLA